ncbi:MAG: c-type cytochrome [gamma proteobacterium symbiont of Bathyaustriella thionipta]|nr:c-type cytochrome [gamma proteobacterium symbiont of Bathyaustriella thionipta]MCU7949835.1 c-type cytochrome [gamma proteobacterium symbiont of Bathyaustriella thionipta]MCU7954093.1 c-type cytochrome [gamma proteobacterium symbiont of Bathyaustriella thionipta]MCU7956409.1 c-type cytochrome [gamma proteobacterium symbiont of Bathyaustriella thionipta]MCU7966700.1 c-type cytochrome [gamma proteobacterium symbiont of Bathyaustriella thionipta]
MNKQYNVSSSCLSALLLILSVYSLNAQAVEPTGVSQESLANYTPVLSADFKVLLKTADAAAGEEMFMRKCSSCHDNFKSETHGKGPNLWNVFGRKAGTSEGFEYSDAMRQSGHTWGYATLNYYLTRTDRAVPGRIMNFRGIRQDAYRARLLRFLRTMNDQPPPLP